MPHTTTHCECETHWRVWLDQLTLTASSTIHDRDSLVDKQVYLLKPCSPQMTQRMLLVSSSVAYIVETLHLTSDVVDYSLVNFDITPPINKMTYTGWWLGLQLPDDIEFCKVPLQLCNTVTLVNWSESHLRKHNKKAQLTPAKCATAMCVWRLVFAISTLSHAP